MTRFRRLAALLFASLAVLTVATGCAIRTPTAPPPAPADPASAFPAKIQPAGQEPVTIPQKPSRIVSLSPTATETLYAIGAGAEVVAVDQQSDFPEQAPRTNLSGMGTDAAAVGGHRPDLVIVPDSATELAEGLRAIEVPVLVTPSAASLDDAYTQIETLGRATGHKTQAQDLTGRMRADIDKIVRDTPRPDRPLSYYHEVSSDHYTATSRSFPGSVYALFGLTNIADPAGGKFPQISAEHILEADPGLIFVSGRETPQQVAARPGWNTVTAVREGRVVPLDSDVAARWGPRVVEMVRAVSDAVAKTPAN